MSGQWNQLFAFRSFRSRLLVLLLALLLPVLLLIYLYVNYQNTRYTEDTIDSYLELGADVFDFSREEHKDTLLTITSTLTRDWGFRNAFGSADPATIRDAAETLLARSFGAADMMLIADLDGQVIMDTSDQGFEKLGGEWRAMMQSAEQHTEGIADAILTVDDIPYQVTAVPLFLPRPVAWIFGGFALDVDFVERVKQSVVSDISLLRYRRGPGTANLETTVPAVDVIASTLGEADQTLLTERLDTSVYSDTRRVQMSNAEFGTLVRSLYGEPGGALEIVAVIQRSYDENEANLQIFRTRLIQFYVLIVFVSIVGSAMLARTVTRPVLALLDRVKRIDRGDYESEDGLAIHLRRGRDEIARLTQSVDSMARGLAEKERVRGLLGKVVSHEIAEELLSRRVELGGEERVVSVLFADIQGFTSLSESRAPSEVLNLLNSYLSEITEAIELHHGVVDKYTGDAVMALFGAPVSHDDDVSNAVRAVETIRDAVARANQQGGENEQLSVGAGLHTGLVVAGNMGSSSRMNYTVIGDAVNVAARLEGLTRFYGVSSIVSEASREAASDDMRWREIDRVRVKGRQQPVRIFELLGSVERVPESTLRAAREFEKVLAHYRSREWEQALDILHTLQSTRPEKLYTVYIDRIMQLREHLPPDWDATHTFDRK